MHKQKCTAGSTHTVFSEQQNPELKIGIGALKSASSPFSLPVNKSMLQQFSVYQAIYHRQESIASEITCAIC